MFMQWNIMKHMHEIDTTYAVFNLGYIDSQAITIARALSLYILRAVKNDILGKYCIPYTYNFNTLILTSIVAFKSNKIIPVFASPSTCKILS